MRPVDLRAIQIGGEIGRRIDITANVNLLDLAVDRDFLDPFRHRVSRSAADGSPAPVYVGLGKLIDSTARLAAYTDSPQILARRQYLVDEILKTQDDDGYIGTMPPSRRVTQLWDMHEMGYLIYGLVTDNRLFGEVASLDAARRLADYYLRHWPSNYAWAASGHDIGEVAVIGGEGALLALYEATQDARYLDFVLHVRRLPERDVPIEIGRHSRLDGHAYAYLSTCLAQLRLYRYHPDPRLLRPTSATQPWKPCTSKFQIRERTLWWRMNFCTFHPPPASLGARMSCKPPSPRPRSPASPRDSMRRSACRP